MAWGLWCLGGVVVGRPAVMVMVMVAGVVVGPVCCGVDLQQVESGFRDQPFPGKALRMPAQRSGDLPGPQLGIHEGTCVVMLLQFAEVRRGTGRQ